MTTTDFGNSAGSPSNVIDFNSRRDPRAVAIRESQASLLRLTQLVGRIENRVARSTSAQATEEPDAAALAAWEAGLLRDDVATAKAVRKAHKALRDRLPAVAAALLAQSDRLAGTETPIDGPFDDALLREVAAVFEALINPKGVLGEDSCSLLSEAIALVRGIAYVAINGDVTYSGVIE